MGSVVLPTTGLVYVDANVVIYTIEKHPRYGPAKRPLWSAVSAGQAQVATSELIFLETLVGPYRSNDSQLADDYEMFFRMPGIELVPITPFILREAARFRSRIPRLRSPDAIHLATATTHGAISFVTNDVGFRNIPGLNVVLLDDVITSASTV